MANARVILERDEKTSVIEETGIKVATLVADKVNKVEQDVGLLCYVPMIYKSSLNYIENGEEQVKDVEKENKEVLLLMLLMKSLRKAMIAVLHQMKVLKSKLISLKIRPLICKWMVLVMLWISLVYLGLLCL